MGYGPTWPTDRAVVWTRDLERCVLCGQRVQDGHHREVQGMGGRAHDDDRHRPDRVLSVCRVDHGLIHGADRELATALGYFVDHSDLTVTSEDQPVWYKAEKCWFLLTPGGTRLYHQQPAPKEEL